MKKENVDLFMINKGKYFKSEHQVVIRQKLEEADDNLYTTLLSLEFKDPTITIVLALFNFDRFYIGDIGLGILKFLFWWLTLGIWPLVDLFTTYKKAKQLNYNKLMMIL